MVWENDPEEGAVRLRRDEENEKHLFSSWDFPKSQSVPNQEKNSIMFPLCASQNECHIGVKHLLYLLVHSAYGHLGQWQGHSSSSHKLSTYSLLCCPFEREDGSGWGHGVLEVPWNECHCGHHGGCSLGSCCLVWREFQEGSGIDFERSDAIPKTLLFG